jgi:glycosyl hydrolase family 42 (putative beta-galactosidase)
MRRRTFLGAAAGAAAAALGWRLGEAVGPGPPSLGFDTMILAQGATLSSNIPEILAHDGVVGVAHSFPWSLIEPSPGSYDLSWLDQALAVCRAAGAGYAPRFRTGRQTPPFGMGRTWIPPDGPGAGEPAPMPVNDDGTPNETFLTALAQLLAHLGAWCDANLGSNPADGPLHAGWFASGSSELFVDDYLYTLPGATDDSVIGAHLALLRTVADTPTTLRVELPISGLQPGAHLSTLEAALAEAMVTVSQRRPFWTQRNGFSDEVGTGVWAYGSAPPHGLQMVKAFRPDGTSFDWPTVYGRAEISFSIEAERGYLEVYEQSFDGDGSDQLYAEAAAYT